MRLTILGSSGTYPVAGRPASGYLIEQGDTRVWCDAGPGTFTALPIDAALVDAVVLSHRHPDHCSDLLTAYHVYGFGPEPRVGIPLFAPLSVIEALVAFAGEQMGRVFDFRPVDGGDRVEIGALGVAFARTDHSVPTVASRWETESRALFYTADTGPEGEWMRLGEDADLFLSEASYQGPPGLAEYPHHLTAGQAGEIARGCGARELMLTHIPPHLDPARSVIEAETTFDRPVRLAVPGAALQV